MLFSCCLYNTQFTCSSCRSPCLLSASFLHVILVLPVLSAPICMFFSWLTVLFIPFLRRWTWTGDFKCREVKTGFCRNRSMQTGSSGTLIGWKSGQTTFVPLWDWMEGAWLRTLHAILVFLSACSLLHCSEYRPPFCLLYPPLFCISSSFLPVLFSIVLHTVLHMLLSFLPPYYMLLSLLLWNGCFFWEGVPLKGDLKIVVARSRFISTEGLS